MEKNTVTPEKIEDFYRLLGNREGQLGSKRLLKEVGTSDKSTLAVPGVYFFFEHGETRPNSGGLRVVRVGTATDLYKRLSNHRSGNRTRSNFCDVVGDALENENRVEARDLKGEIIKRIRCMQFVWIEVDEQDRKLIEKSAIGLLSARGRVAGDASSKTWLGRCSRLKPVRKSRLWNSQHVDYPVEPDEFLKKFKCYIRRTGSS